VEDNKWRRKKEDVNIKETREKIGIESENTEAANMCNFGLCLDLALGASVSVKEGGK
jgi:hypothetical protein